MYRDHTSRGNFNKSTIIIITSTIPVLQLQCNLWWLVICPAGSRAMARIS